MSKNIIEHNTIVWDKLAQNQCAWSQPVSSEVIKNAQNGNWQVHITKKPIPTDWLPKNISRKKILCLASAGGQQAPVLAAAGADVTVFDISYKQLEQDKLVAKRDGLKINIIQGDMTDLFELESNSFEYIIHPISNLYIPDLSNLWRESYRVLKKGGTLLASFYNPVLFIFEKNNELSKQGLLKPKYTLPYSDQSSLSNTDYQNKLDKGEPVVFGHTLTEQINKQIEAGFVINGFYEDDHPYPRFLIEKYLKTMIATKATKL